MKQAQYSKKAETTKVTDSEINTYDPNRLLDALLTKMQWKNDAVMAQKLNVHNNVIPRIRTRILPLTTSMLLWMQDATGIGIDELRQLMGDRRAKLRVSCTYNQLNNRINYFNAPSYPSALRAMPMSVKLAEPRGLHIPCKPSR
ncbi:MAG: hypothetical protein ACOH2B_02285 [Burkholderiaceae bacterium]